MQPSGRLKGTSTSYEVTFPDDIWPTKAKVLDVPTSLGGEVMFPSISNKAGEPDIRVPP